jgi:hypothetical protein
VLGASKTGSVLAVGLEAVISESKAAKFVKP